MILEPGIYLATDALVHIKERADWTVGAGRETPRRQIVLDLHPSVAADLAGMMHEFAVEATKGWTSELLTRVAAMIEAQCKPPLLPEPGQWGVVSARAVDSLNWQSWLRHPLTGWHPISGGVATRWTDLGDPILIRDGLEP